MYEQVSETIKSGKQSGVSRSPVSAVDLLLAQHAKKLGVEPNSGMPNSSIELSALEHPFGQEISQYVPLELHTRVEDPESCEAFAEAVNSQSVSLVANWRTMLRIRQPREREREREEKRGDSLMRHGHL